MPPLATLNTTLQLVIDAYLAEHKEDDDEPIDEAWLRSLGYSDSAYAPNTKRFELCSGVRIMFVACSGPECWKTELWVGSNTPHRKSGVSRGQLRKLLEALEVNHE